MEGLVWLALIVGAVTAYQKWLIHGVRTRQVKTVLPVDQIRSLFVAKVAVMGWKVVDDDDPMVAESSAWAGIQQQIGLWVNDQGSERLATISVLRYSKRILGGITKAHTLRIRMSAFVQSVQEADPAAVEEEVA
jgi:hypothetical protein